ncbi:hypothetical protein ACHAXT_003482 [Thalassiosira profunda]
MSAISRRRPHGAPAYIQRSRATLSNAVNANARARIPRARVAYLALAFVVGYVLFESEFLFHGNHSEGELQKEKIQGAHNGSSAALLHDGHEEEYHAAEVAMGERLLEGEKEFVAAARSLSPITDKVTTHRYHPMYGQFLLPYYHRKPSMKMLEIGLGCDMNYEPGASVALWRKLFPKANLWEAEYNGTCVELATKQGKLDGFNTLVGDQGNDKTLDEWIEKSGGNFDVIIDDGGHQNCQIMASFLKLWPTVKPGGLYFIEDIQVGKWRGFRRYSTASCEKTFTFSDKLQEWLDDLVYQGGYGSHKWDVHFMYCQAEACVLGKKPLESDSNPHVKHQLLAEESLFVETAGSLTPITDKITTHSFYTMYGQFLIPYYRRKPSMKMLEIGLGCDMNYEPGASVALWKKLFPQADLWEAEYDAKCVELAKKQGKLDGFNTLVGDQGNNQTLDGWIKKSGGEFDIIIDDGGHHNCQIDASFAKLWPTVKPGGLYFLEDLSVGKWMGYRKYSTATCPKTFIFSHKLQSWLEDLIYQGGYGSRKWDIQFLFCQAEACVVGKKPPETSKD